MTSVETQPFDVTKYVLVISDENGDPTWAHAYRDAAQRAYRPVPKERYPNTRKTEDRRLAELYARRVSVAEMKRQTRISKTRIYRRLGPAVLRYGAAR